MMYLLQKEFMEDYLCWYAQREEVVPHKTMIKRMVESICSSKNVNRVVDANNNSYKNIVMDVMRMNKDGISECRIIIEEPNGDATSFFYLLEDYDEPL